MDLTFLPLVFAQAQPAAPNPGAMSSLALRRWCSGLTLSSPESGPSFHGLSVFLIGLGLLFLLALARQGPVAVFKQLFNLVGHARLVRTASARVWRANRMVSIAIGVTVLAWTASQAFIFAQESRKLDLILLTKSRLPAELAAEQGILAALTPLRDVAGLADNLPLLAIAALLIFRASFDISGWGNPAPEFSDAIAPSQVRGGWSTLAWGCASLYALYRLVSRLAGSTDLPLGNCLVIETIVIPTFMAVCDGVLLAWLLTELRSAGLEDAGADRLDVRQALALIPAAAVVCVAVLPARYIATFVWLALVYVPTSASTSLIGDYMRWQLGWGLTDLQAIGIPSLGLVGAVAWSRGTISSTLAGYFRLLSFEGGNLLAVAIMAGIASGLGAAAAYAVVLLLPAQTWVLAAADSYAHFATLPVGLWTLAALVELAQRSLPVAPLADLPEGRVSLESEHLAESAVAFDDH